MNRDLPDTRAFAPFEWMLALRYLRARRKEGFISVISLFSFLGILLGVATLIVVMAVLNGFRAELLDKILGFAGHVAIYRQDAGTIMNDGEIRLRMEKIPGVVRVVTLVEGQAMAASLHSATGALVRGISEADIAQLPSINNEKLTTALMVAGVPDAAASFTGFDAAAGVAIGKRMAWRHRLALGSTLTIISPNGPETVVGNTPTIRDFQVVAIFDAGMSDYDENVIYMPLAAAKEYFNTEGGVSMIEATIADPEAVDGMVADFAAAAGPDMLVQTWKQRNMTFFDALAVERNVMFLVLTMIILVAALNIISGLIMLVKDKGRDIAILRTMGATRGAIQRVFFLTGAAIGTVGTLGGFVTGLLICLNVESIRKLIGLLTGVDPFNPEIYYLAQLPARMDSWQTLWIVLMSLGLSFGATLYPAWRAARLDPVEALRYE
jgi:lipoprotein-releasing system permease protein